MAPALITIICPNCGQDVELLRSNSIIQRFQGRPELEHFETVCQNKEPDGWECLQTIMVWPSQRQLSDARRFGWGIRSWLHLPPAVIAEWEAHGHRPPAAI